MANLSNLLRNLLKKNDGQEFAPLVKVDGANLSGNMPDGTLAQTQAVQVEPLQVDNNGQLIDNPNIQPMRNGGLGTKLGYYAKNTRNKFMDALLGKSADNTDNISGQNITVSDGPRVGGLLNDLKNGYNENRNTAFDVKNWDDTTQSNGIAKGNAYRIGEGLGTIARGLNRGGGVLGQGLKKVGQFADTPLGRMAIMGGIVGATGGSGLEALAYGGTAGVLNQANRLKDRLYRDELNKLGIDTSNLKGYINDNTFKNISTQGINNMKMTNARDIAQAKDNRERAKMILDGVKNGTITPESASQQIRLYGITDADLTASNESRKTDAIVETTLNPKPKVVEMHYSGLPTDKTITVKNTYEQLGGTGGKYKPAEGTTATNPQTGETLIYRSGKWQSM